MRGMVRRSVVVIVVAFVNTGLAWSAAAQTPAAVPEAVKASAKLDKLQPLAFLAGSCWMGTFAGRAVTDEHCFRWILGDRFLRDHHVVRGDSVPYEGESTYAWDAVQKRITYWYIALPGFYSHGNVESTDGALVFHDDLVTSTARQLLSTWRRSGRDAYTVKVQEISDGKSKELWSIVMRRTGPAPE
jgi:hypothetical protein